MLLNLDLVMYLSWPRLKLCFGVKQSQYSWSLSGYNLKLFQTDTMEKLFLHMEEAHDKFIAVPGLRGLQSQLDLSLPKRNESVWKASKLFIGNLIKSFT